MESVYVSIPYQPPVKHGAVPGAKIHVTQADGSGGNCTLGPAVRQPSTGRTGFLTAGHCAGTVTVDGEYLGEVEEIRVTRDEDADAPVGERPPAEDSGIIWTPRAGEKAAAYVAGRPVIGALSETELHALPRSTMDNDAAGVPVCNFGATTGSWCSSFWGAGGYIGSGGGIDGDSGSPMFLVDGDGNAILIGVVDDPAGASILARTLRRLKIQPITAF
ncbi:chymotrypsin family serine protease [Mycolicibacterium fallax]|uniref:hypothetical protein n=1 Tax=Mycolicibacterium fallax TaxID=1793 RepID=UPI0013D39307|nr:hypothetical protein [Mycolicibacterium fallax]